MPVAGPLLKCRIEGGVPVERRSPMRKVRVVIFIVNAADNYLFPSLLEG